MNRHKIIKIGFALAITAVPFYANAMSHDAGLKACAEAMVNDLAENQGSSMVYNLDPASMGGGKKMGRREVFHLDAFDSEGGKVVARMDCTVNKNAEVTRLVVVPLDSEDARVRATTFN